MADYTLSARAVVDSAGFTSGISSMQSGLSGLVGKFALGNIAADAFGAVVDSVSDSIGSAVARVDTMNNFPRVMENMGVSAEESQASINRLSDGIDGLPTALDSAVSGVQRFTSKNGDIEKSTDYFLAVNDAILSGGQSMDIQASALEQLSQSYSKGKMDMQEWRSIQQAMPAQLNQIAQSMGMTADELGEGLRKGSVSMDGFMDEIVRLDKEGGEGFASFAEQAKTSTGGIQTAMENVQNRVNKAVASVIDEIGGENIAGAINEASSHFKDFAEGPVEFISSFKSAFDDMGLQSRLPELSESLGDLKEAGVDALGELGELFGNLATVGLPVLADLGTGLADFSTMTLNVVGMYLEGINSMFDRSEILDNQFKEAMTSVTGQADQLSYYTSVIEELTEKGELNEQEQVRLQAAVEGYNRITGDSVGVTNAAAGELSKSTDEIKKNADAWIDNAYAQVYANQMAALAEDSAKKQGELSDATYELAVAQRNLNAAYDNNGNPLYPEGEMERLQGVYDRAAKKAGDLTSGIEQNNDKMQELGERAGIANQSLLMFVERQGDLSLMLLDAGVAAGGFTQCLDAIGVSEEGLAEMTPEAKRALVDLAGAAADMGASVGISAADMMAAFQEAGVSADDLANVSTEGFQRIWEECGGDVSLLKGAIDEYNAVEMEAKEAEVTDNGTAEEVTGKLDEVAGKLEEVDGAEAEVTITANDLVSGVIDTIQAKIAEVRGSSASGGGGHAAGGFEIPRHASGGILDGPTLTNIGWVGEDGAEAIIPLTNQYYMRQFARPLAAELAGFGAGDVYNTYYVNADAVTDARVADAVELIVDAATLRREMGRAYV